MKTLLAESNWFRSTKIKNTHELSMYMVTYFLALHSRISIFLGSA